MSLLWWSWRDGRGRSCFHRRPYERHDPNRQIQRLLGGDRTGPRGASRRGAGGGGQTTRRYEGEIANADMSLKEGATGTEQVMIDLCRECLASYRCPRQIQFVDDIPKTSTNKIIRGELHTLDGD